MFVRAFQPDDLEFFKDVRLRALVESPDAFGSTAARERGFTDREWLQRALKPRGGDGLLVLAFEGERALGMAGVMREPGRPGVGQIWGMWVQPSARGRGVAAEMIEHLARWAAGSGTPTLELWVVESNTRAIRVYERAGFRDTGDRQPMPRDASLVEERMERRP